MTEVDVTATASMWRSFMTLSLVGDVARVNGAFVVPARPIGAQPHEGSAIAERPRIVDRQVCADRTPQLACDSIHTRLAFE
jgi:hypothetical protein